MDPPPLPPSSTTSTAVTSPTFPASTTKLRLMCSYGGHIVPRPQTNSLIYVGGDTRIIALDLRTTAASLSALTAHLSRTLFNQRPFYLKYQLPNEDLDSLVSVTNDEDFQNMVEEHDRVTGSAGSTTQSRIRLFLFPIKPESIGSMLVDRKSDSWFSDALNNTGIRMGQSTDTGLGREFSGLDTVGGLDSNATLQVQRDGVKNGGDGCSNGGAAKVVSGKPESLVLETCSSFGSTSSLVSMANSPAIGIQPEGDSMGLLEKKIRVPSSASIESDNGVGSNNVLSKKEIHHEQLIQVSSGVLSFNGEMENPNTDLPSTINMHKAVQFSGHHHLPPQSEGKHLQYELPYTQGGLQYTNQYSTGQLPLASYYPMYPLPVQHQMQSPYLLNQPYPVYLVPVRPNLNCNMSTEGCLSDNANAEASRPPLHPQNAVDQTPRAYNEVTISQHMPQTVVKTNHPLSSMTPVVLAPSSQVKQQFEEHPELSHPSRTATAGYVATSNYVSEFSDRLAYTQMYKAQPPAPAFTPQCQTSKETTVLPSESSTKQQTALQHQTSSYAQ